MALCTRCGTLMHDEDMSKHTCNELDIPLKDVPIRKGEKINA